MRTIGAHDGHGERSVGRPADRAGKAESFGHLPLLPAFMGVRWVGLLEIVCRYRRAPCADAPPAIRATRAINNRAHKATAGWARPPRSNSI